MTGYYVLRLFHLMFAMLWFGVGLTLPGDVRRTLSRGRPQVDTLPERAQRASIIALGSGVLALATGVGLIINKGGFKMVSVRVHAGLGLALLLLAVTVLGLLTHRKIAGIIRGGGDLEPARVLAKRVSMLSGIEQLVWLIILTLMVVPLF